MSQDEDDELWFEVRPLGRKSQASSKGGNDQLEKAPQDEPQKVNDDLPQASPQSWNASEDSANITSMTSSNSTTKVEKLALLLASLSLHIHGVFRGAPLALQVAGMMTVVLGIVLLTALTLLMRRSCAHFDLDQAEALRPAPVDKLLLHSHTAAAKSSLLHKSLDMFCPELIVPEGSECALKIPRLAPPSDNPGPDQGGGDSISHIVDQDGGTCLCVRILSSVVPYDRVQNKIPGDHALGSSLRLHKAAPGLSERIVLMSPTRLRVLAYCERRDSSFHVHGHDDELFARLSRDETGAYTMVGRSGTLLLYNGQLTEGTVRVTDTESQVLAYCEKCDSSNITLKAGPLADVGLIICGLLALDRMETERVTSKASMMNTVLEDRLLPRVPG
jgi:hypothetical protein